MFLWPNCSEEVSQLCADQLVNSTCNGGALPGIEVYNYVVNVPLDACNGWTISWSLCCRASAQNLVGNALIYIEARVNTITAPCDNSPQFAESSVPYVCVGQTVNYNFGVSDPDGDSLVYDLIDARSSAFTPVPYQGTLTGALPIAGITFDNTTGQVTFTPTGIGYLVVVLRARTYNQNGQLIGYVMRDIPFIVYDCANSAPDPTSGSIANVTGDGAAMDSSSAAVCAEGSICFDVAISDADSTQSITLSTNIATVLPGANFDVSGTNPVTAHICWNAAGAVPGDNVFTITATDDACPQTASQIYTYTISVSDNATANADTVICPGDSAQLSVVGGSAFTWSPSAGIADEHLQQITVSPSLTTVYTVTTNLPLPCNTDQVLVTVLDPSDPLCIALSVGPVHLDNDLRLFPNPSNGMITLELDASLLRGSQRVEVLDATGRVRAAFTPHVVDGTVQLYLPASLANGAYALRMISNDGARTRSFELLR